jgi:hypothetical protein
MQDRIRKTIPVNDDISVICYEDPTHGEGSYIFIKHNRPVHDMPGEILIAPADTPALVKAITEAAISSTLIDGLRAGQI